MDGIEEMYMELARQRHAERIQEASLERALAASTTNADYATGIGSIIAIGILTDGVRGLWRWLTTPRPRPAAAR